MTRWPWDREDENSDRHDRVHEVWLDHPDCEQCQVLLADQRHEAEHNMRAALAEDPRLLRRDRYCVQGVGFNAECADPAYEKRAGFWYCDRHAAAFDFDVQAGLWADEQEAQSWHRAQGIDFEVSPGFRLHIPGE